MLIKRHRYHYKICPWCGGSNTKRLHRKKWMHYIPASKYYSCSNCGMEYLSIFGKFYHIIRDF
ncbi:MAG TPA: YgiT-type zinc finger protein [Candidatus Marinimicrobia bacterium]|nr:YgiT-type zinc finger protein [Candidatus Neomarinimicrobiota bacterium]